MRLFFRFRMAGFILQDGQIVLNMPGIGAPPKPDKS